MRPWQVKGVAPAAQETAQEAARRSGLSVGEWLNSVIFGSVDKRPARPTGGPPNGRDRAPRSDRHMSAINDRLDHLTRKIDRLSQTGSAAPAPRSDDDDETPRRLADAIVGLDRRLDELIQEGRRANRELERRVNGVDQALAALGEARLGSAFVAGPESVEQAVAEIAARQRVLDGDLSGPAACAPSRAEPRRSAPPRSETDLSGLEQQLRQITAQLELLQRPCRADEAIAALRHDLAEIGRTLREAMPRRAVEALEGEVRKLASQIDAGRRSGGVTPDIAGLERGLGEVRDALHALTPAESLVGFDEAVKTLSRKIDLLPAGGADPAALQQLESAIGGLRALVSHVASGEALAALADEVRALRDQVERGAASTGHDLLLGLERRIAAIADAIETVRQDNARAVPPGLDSLMRSLSDKLEHLQLTRSDQLAFGNLEERITRLVEKLDASEAKLGHLESIERGMAELLVHLEELRTGQNPRAPHAAAAAPAGIMSAVPSVPPMETAPDVMDMLTRDVARVRESQSAIGRRTEDSLEAVQGTIGDVVNRLAMIESGLRTDAGPDPGAPEESVPGKAAAPIAVDAPLARSDVPPDALLLADAPSPAPPRSRRAAPLHPPIDPSLPPDYPLEPGTGMPRPGANAAARIAASDAPLRAAKPDAPPDDVEDPSNFLQAARRAAKAASQQGPAGDAEGDAAAGSKTLSDRLKQLFVGAGIIVCVAAAFRFAGVYLDPDRVILADAPVAHGEIAPPVLQVPTTARTIVVPEPPAAGPVQPSAVPTTTAAIIAAPPPALGSSSGVLAVERPAPAAAAAAPAAAPASRGEITGSVPARQGPPAPAIPAEPAPTAAPPAEPPTAGISKGLMAAAGSGDGAAAHEIATRYAEGRGVPQSYKEAAVWFERAAKRDLAPSQFRLGTMYEKGLGVTKNLQEARRLYLAAADKGNPKAMHNIAVLYAEGIEGKPDYRSAVQWFRKAAGYGIADSQYNLAILHARGIGVEQSLSESYKWFALAANSGDQEAAKKRDEIAGRLDGKALAAARLAVKAWSVTQAPEEATTVKPPPGGWEQLAAPADDKAKPRRRASRPASASR